MSRATMPWTSSRTTMLQWKNLASAFQSVLAGRIVMRLASELDQQALYPANRAGCEKTCTCRHCSPASAITADWGRMMRWLVGILGLVWCCVAAGVRAQVPEVPHLRLLEARDGLPSTELTAIEIDHAGFVWVGSADGLARYDGHGFRIWRYEPHVEGALPSNSVQALHVDSQDRLWVAVEFGGLAVLGKDRSRFQVINNKTHPQLGNGDVFAIASHADKHWIGTSNAGVFQVITEGDSSARWRLEALSALPSKTVLSMVADTQGGLWIGTSRGLVYWDGKTLHPQTLPEVDSPGMVYSLLLEHGRLWAGTAAGVFRREVDGRWVRLPWSPMFERPNAVVSMARGTDGTMWLGSQRRLWRVAGDNAIPLPVTADPGATSRLVLGLKIQGDGGLWAGVSGVGLGFLRADWRSVAELRQGDGEYGLASPMYRALAPSRKGGVWIAGVDGHIERIDAAGVVEYINLVQHHEELRRIKPMVIYEDRKQRLWLGDSRLGLIRLDEKNQLRRWHAESSEDALPANGFLDLMTTGIGDTLWLSIQGYGLQQRDIETGKVLKTIEASEQGGLGSGDSEDIGLGPDGRLWVAGSHGLGWLDETRNRLVIPDSLAGKRVFAFAFDGPDVLWLHRLEGLERYQYQNGAWQKVAEVTAGQGLPVIEAGGLAIDARHRVWVSGRRGLFLWDGQRTNLHAYGIANGFVSQEFLDRALVLTDKGLLAAPTDAGSVVLIDTRYPDPAARKPVLKIDSVDVRRNGEWVSQRLGDEALVFGAQDRELRLTGHLLTFDDPAAVRYWSRLQGFDKDWVDHGAQGERIFTGLPPGQYVLHMRARDGYGNMAEEQRLAFVVTPPWWRSRVAMLLAGALLLLVLWALIRIWRQRLKRKHEWQLAEQRRLLAEQASEAKTRFLATMGHEIRTPLTGVLGMSELLQSTALDSRQRAQVEAIHSAGKHLLHLVNDALDLARVEAGKLVLVDAPFDMRQLVNEVAALMQPLAMKKGLKFDCQISADAPGWLLGDRTRVEQILLNLLGNAIKFTEYGQVSLQVMADEAGGVAFHVRDTGPGLGEEERKRLFQRFEQGDAPRNGAGYGGSGLGLAISRELVLAMGGHIELQSKPGQGSCFSVALPLPLAEAVSTPATTTPAPPAPGSQRHLLLVEDDPLVAEVLVSLLQAQGHRVCHAEHALAALAENANHVFDVLLLDLDLPGMNGFDLAAQLRASGQRAPLIAVTASSAPDLEAKVNAAGFDYLLRKPVTAEALAAALAAVIHRA
ncbi:hypothetical protein CO614_06685 [Lysobacteraceae bacterium NML120232]|nr:hypothetical protein CO614_06685 [Xanthomonadaceae bacterium NML120232]